MLMTTQKYAAMRVRSAIIFLFLTIRGLIVVVVEMKSGRIQTSNTEARHIAEQLGNGAKESEKLVQSGPDSTFRPILLYGSMKSRMRKLLAKCEVTFKGKKHKWRAQPEAKREGTSWKVEDFPHIRRHSRIG